MHGQQNIKKINKYIYLIQYQSNNWWIWNMSQ